MSNLVAKMRKSDKNDAGSKKRELSEEVDKDKGLVDGKEKPDGSKDSVSLRLHLGLHS